MGHLSFCDFNMAQFKAIYNLLGETFHTSESELQGLYQALRDDFNYDDWPQEVCVARQFFTPLDESFRPKYDQAEVVACDLPSLLSRGGQKTVMIVAQDALSNLPSPDAVRIGTPYALHIKKCREELYNTRRYFQLLDVLLHQGYQVYLTDLYKIYADGVRLTKQDRQRFSEVLKQEIEILHPNALITWGRKATVAVQRLGIERPHYDYPHPSGSARWAWEKLIGQPATDKNIFDYWQKDLAQKLAC